MNSRIAYVTDVHLDEATTSEQGVDARKNWLKIIQDISSKGIEEVIIGGDIGEATSNQWFFETLSDYDVSISLGNHDYFEEVVKHFDVGLHHGRKELYYSRSDQDYKFLFLDSSSGQISQEQYEWFKKEVRSSKSILLFIHHPILAVHAEVDKLYALEGRDRLKAELLNIPNAVSVFSGHYHFEDEHILDNIRQVITPAASFQVEKIPNEIKTHNQTFGYRIIELGEGEIESSLVMFQSDY